MNIIIFQPSASFWGGCLSDFMEVNSKMFISGLGKKNLTFSNEQSDAVSNCNKEM